MKTKVKVTFKNGDSLVTDINLDLKSAKKYYLGKVFNLGCEDDNMQTAVSVEEV